MPAVTADRGTLDELSEELRAIANLVARWPTNARGDAHVEITDLLKRFREIHEALHEAAEKDHDLTDTLGRIAASLQAAAKDLQGGSARGR
jgi:hypothetical protein